MHPARRRALRRLGAAAAQALGLAVLAPGAARSETPVLDRLRQRGRLVVGVYHDLPPFHQGGRGIEVELAEALARSLGLGLSLLPFHADENMQDDLRNMVWKGHYLGHGPADVMLHVPVDRPLMDATPQVTFLAPYYRESVALARNLERLPRLESLAPLAQERVAVPGQSLAGWLLIGADGGAYTQRLSTQWKDGTEAARALLAGTVTVAAGHRCELESVLGKDPRFAIDALPSPRAPRDGWAVGCAVKRESTDLALALQTAMNGLAADGSLAGMFGRAGVSWRKP